MGTSSRRRERRIKCRDCNFSMILDGISVLPGRYQTCIGSGPSILRGSSATSRKRGLTASSKGDILRGTIELKERGSILRGGRDVLT